MKILKKIIALIIIVLMTLTNTAKADIFSSSSFNTNNKNIVRAAVLLYSFDDLFMLQIKQNLEAIERENKDKIRFTFYDGKNNIAVQNETIDSISRSNTDLIIANLADISEPFVENVILSVKPKNIPLILLSVDPQAVDKASKYYDKVVFTLENANEAAAVQAKILIDLWNTNKKTLDKNNDNILQYVLLRGESDNPVAINRTKYVISALNNAGIKTQELALVNANWLKELARNSVDNLFLKYGGSIEAIISNNDAMAIGAIEALQKYGYNKGNKTKSIAVVGIDALPEAKELVDKGFMTGTVIQDPKTVAELLYRVGMNLVNNLKPTENTDYKIVNGQIIIPFKYQAYTSNTNAL